MTLSLPATEPAIDEAGQTADPAILDRLDHWHHGLRDVGATRQDEAT
jgi:hypothetical protein